MTTDHERLLKASFYEAIQEDPQAAAMAAEVRSRILAGDFYSVDVLNAAFQKWERDKEITLIDAFGFALIWTHYLHGDIAYCSVPLPSGPEADREITSNQATLDQLPRGFRAKFVPERGRGANDDGLFTIEKGIGLWRKFWDKDTKEERDEEWYFDSDLTISLEVGTTSVSKTLYHLRCASGVARWPYGCNKIIVLAGVKTNVFRNAIAERNKASSLQTGKQASP